jgi:hypothetical protein
VASGREETAGDRGLRIGENCARFALFNDAPMIEHDDAPGDRPQDARFVGFIEACRAALFSPGRFVHAKDYRISSSRGRSNRETVSASSIKGQPERISADNFASSR